MPSRYLACSITVALGFPSDGGCDAPIASGGRLSRSNSRSQIQGKTLIELFNSISVLGKWNVKPASRRVDSYAARDNQPKFDLTCSQKTPPGKTGVLS